MLELLTIVVPGDLRGFGKAAVVGAALHLGKLAALTLAGLILRVPVALLLLGLGWSATTHVLFGALGGVLGALALRRVAQDPVPRRAGEGWLTCGASDDGPRAVRGCRAWSRSWRRG